MKYWVTIELTPHRQHPPSYPGPRVPELKALFDEDAMPDVPVAKTEHSAGPLSFKVHTYGFEISKAEYDKSQRHKLYLWAEPQALVAFVEPRSHDGIAVGRIVLTERNMKRRGGISVPDRALGIADGDMGIHYEVILVNSVTQFMADEITRNVKDPRVTQLAQSVTDLQDRQRRADATPDSWTVPSDNPLGAAPNPGVITKPALEAWNTVHDLSNLWRWGRPVHNNRYDFWKLFNLQGSAWGAVAQEFLFLGGGEWDHKPRIEPIWGVYNRLGNKGEIWFYDIWSNIHYGCVGRAAGLPLSALTSGAGAAQAVDSGSTSGDDVIDAEGIIAGYNLYSGPRIYTAGDLLAILAAHPHWEIKLRWPGK